MNFFTYVLMQVETVLFEKYQSQNTKESTVRLAKIKRNQQIIAFT